MPSKDARSPQSSLRADVGAFRVAVTFDDASARSSNRMITSEPSVNTTLAQSARAAARPASAVPAPTSTTRRPFNESNRAATKRASATETGQTT